MAASALTDADPGAVLATLDRYAATVPGARCATVSYAVIDDGSDPDTGDGVARVSYSLCGTSLSAAGDPGPTAGVPVGWPAPPGGRLG